MFEEELVGNLLLVLFNPSTTGESADTCTRKMQTFTFKKTTKPVSL